MSKPKLKPCPFCRENEQDIINREGEIAIRCQHCGAYGPWADSVAGAKELWNERKVPNEPTGWWLISAEDAEVIKAGLKAPTHGANDFNCYSWPPGEECKACEGKKLRDKAIYVLDVGLYVADVPDDEIARLEKEGE